MQRKKYFIGIIIIFIISLISIGLLIYFGSKVKSFDTYKFEAYLKEFNNKNCLSCDSNCCMNSTIVENKYNSSCINYDYLINNANCFNFTLELKYNNIVWTSSIPITKCYNITSTDFVYIGMDSYSGTGYIIGIIIFSAIIFNLCLLSLCLLI